MEITRASIGALAAFCVTAGAGGAYLALRSSEPALRGSEPAPTAIGTEAPVDSPAPPAPVAPSFPADPLPTPPRSFVSRTPQAQATSAPTESTPELDRLTLPVATVEVQNAAPPALEPARPPEREPIRAVEPPSPEFEELVVSAGSVIGLQMETSITSEDARVEDQVVARVTRDCVADGRVVIPAGARAHGEVTLVERGGRLRDRARLGVRFTLVVLPDGMRVPLETETIYRDGDAPGGESTARIGGGALGGAILGGIFGGRKGAVIGGSVGAGAGTAAALADGRNPATLARGTPITVRLTAPTILTLQKE